jgi:autotransporter-associated beta strand protein
MKSRAVTARVLAGVLVSCLVAVSATRPASAQIPLGSAVFSTYPNGTLVGTNGWQQYLAPSTNPLQVNAGAVRWSGGATTTDDQDAMLSFEQQVTPPLSGTTVLTYDLVMNVAAASVGSPSYFAALNTLTGNTTTNNFQNSRLAVTASGTGFVIGGRVTGQTGYPYRFGTTVLSLNQDYALRAEVYQVAGNANDFIKLYVGPDFSTLTLHATAGYSSGAVTDPTYGAMLLSQFSDVSAVGSTVSVKSMSASYSLTPQPAITRTWSAGSGTWTVDAGNWTGDPGEAWSSTSGSTHVATFNTPSLEVTAVEPVTANGMTFLQPGSVAGGTITLAAKSAAVPFIATTVGVTGSVASELTGSDGLMKTGRGTLVLTGSSSYTGVTSLAAGTLALNGGPNRLPTGGTLSFTGAGAQLDVTTTAQSFSAMTFLTPFSGTAATAISGPGGSVRVSGTSDFEVGPLHCTVAGIATSLSMATLSSFEYDSPQNAFRVGLKLTSTNNVAAGTSSIVLAQHNVITATTLGVADVSSNNNGGGGELLLGESNLLRVKSITQAGGRSDSAIRFQPGLTDPSLVIRGTNGSAATETWLVGSNYQYATAAKRNFVSTVDLSAGEIDALVGNLIVGQADCNRAGRGGTQVSSFVMGSGTLAAGTITVGRIMGGGTNGVAGTFAAYGSLAISRPNSVVSATNVYLAENTITGTGSADRIVSGRISLSAGTLLAQNLARGEQTGRANVVDTVFLWTGGTIGNLPGGNLTIDALPLTVTSGTGTFWADQATITVNATSPIVGSGALLKAGDGTLVLNSRNSFSGGLHITDGTVAIGRDASINSWSVTIEEGASLDVAAVGGGTYSVPSTQTVGGSGRVVGTLEVTAGATLAPGTGLGTLSLTNNLTFGPNGNYNWQMASSPEEGQARTSCDLLTVGGSLTISALASEPFQINLWTLSGSHPTASGSAAGFKRTQDYSWRIATASRGISGFDAEKFRVVSSATNGTDGFANDLGGGAFSVAQSGNDLNLVFTAAMFEINVASGTQTQAQAGWETLSGSKAAAKTGGGTLVVDRPNAITGSVTVESGGLYISNSAALASSRLLPTAGGTVTIAPHLHTTVGGLAPLAGGLIDVDSGMITASSGLSVHELLSGLMAGRGDGSWNGVAGITSTAVAESISAGVPRAIGWLENGDGSVTFGFAAPGDTNLDGQIDILDCLRLVGSASFGNESASSWHDGDFNYDGLFDILDVMAFVSTNMYDKGPYGSAVPAPPDVLLVPVPEPEAAGVMAALAGIACARQMIRRGKQLIKTSV